MKKTYLLLVLMSVSILSGCGNISIPTIPHTSSRTQESESQMIQYKAKLLSLKYPTDYKVEEKGDMVIVSNNSGKIIIGGFKPSVGHPEADENQVVFQKISYNKDPKSELDAVPAALYYKNGDTKIEKELMSILKTVDSTGPKISEATLPPDIHPLQVVKVINDQYAVVVKSSLNVYIPNLPKGFEANYSGILQWNENSGKWEKFLVIEDKNKEISSSNNPVDIWWEGLPDTDQILHLQVVDSNGAGSGEGIAKVLVPTNIGMDEWKVIDCFDYTYDLGKGKNLPLSKKECQAVKIKLYENKTVQTYQNTKYGFAFEYPSNVSVENGWVGISFRVKEPLVIVKNKEGDTLFTLGKTDYFEYDTASKTYILTSPTEIIKLQKNCTKPFLGNQNIYTAEMKLGEGFDSFIIYNILIDKNIGLGIETYRTDMEQPGFTDMKRKLEQERINLEQQILKTFHFTGTSKSLNFTCK